MLLRLGLRGAGLGLGRLRFGLRLLGEAERRRGRERDENAEQRQGVFRTGSSSVLLWPSAAFHRRRPAVADLRVRRRRRHPPRRSVRRLDTVAEHAGPAARSATRTRGAGPRRLHTNPHRPRLPRAGLCRDRRRRRRPGRRAACRCRRGRAACRCLRGPSSVSLPSWPSSVSSPSPRLASASSPGPPRISSSPLPPRTRSLPWPPSIESSPSPPRRLSRPGPPWISSSPPRPLMRSLPPQPEAPCRRRSCRGSRRASADVRDRDLDRAQLSGRERHPASSPPSFANVCSTGSGTRSHTRRRVLRSRTPPRSRPRRTLPAPRRARARASAAPRAPE